MFAQHRSRLRLTLGVLTALVFLPAIATHAASPGTWTLTGSMHTAREYFTATRLITGQVLVTGGAQQGNRVVFNSAELYDPVAGTWTLTGSMATARSFHTASLLPNGQVLVAGGEGVGTIALSSAEIYDPLTGRWTSTGSLHDARKYFTATRLPDGKVLVAGGDVASAELYDPNNGTWTLTGSMATARIFHTASLLLNGQVLVAGGADGAITPLASAEIYDPVTGRWTPIGSLHDARYLHTATRLPSGNVLIVGGYGNGGGSTLTSAELYDPNNGTWTFTGSTHFLHADTTTTLLSNGQVLIAGGYSSGPQASAEVYDPTGGTWTPTGPMNNPRGGGATAALLSSGKVLVAGGCCDTGGNTWASAEVYDPGTVVAVSPARGVVFHPITMTGAEFGPGETVKLYWKAIGPTPSYTAQTAADGSFSTTGQVPPLTTGVHMLLAVGQSSGRTTQTFFTVQPSLTLTPSHGAVGSAVSATGYGFGHNERITLTWDTPVKTLAMTTTDAQGSFTGSLSMHFSVPVGAPRGTHTVTATGQTTHVVATVHFTVN